jgi:hypothetical protein
MPDSPTTIRVILPDRAAPTAIDSQAGTPAVTYRGWSETLQKSAAKVVDLSTERLQAQLDGFINAITPLLAKLPPASHGFSVEEIELSAEISGEGKIELVGGITAGAKGGITFRLRRAAPRAEQSERVT